MKNNNLILIFFFLIAIKSFGQEIILLEKRNDVKVSYKLILENSSEKKDSYIIIVDAENTSSEDLYYEVPLYPNGQGDYNLPIDRFMKGFTHVEIKNSTGIFGNGESIIGDETKYITTDNTQLFKLKKGDRYSSETSFKVKKGTKPIIINKLLKSPEKIDKFDLKISRKMLEGNYISSCGDIEINVKTATSQEQGNYLVQTTNGREFIWLPKTESTFFRKNTDYYSLTFDKSNSSYSYVSEDGIKCYWEKK